MFEMLLRISMVKHMWNVKNLVEYELSSALKAR